MVSLDFEDALKELGKLDQWFEQSKCSNEIFNRLPVDEKVKYHNALITFYDEVLKASSSKQVSDSPLTATEKGAFDFGDTAKWEEV